MAGYQGAPYTHFHELVDTWTKHAGAFQTQVKNLSDIARVLGTSSDTPDVRARLDDNEKRLHALATKTKTILKELADELTKKKKELSRNDMEMVSKLRTDMSNAMKSYEAVVTDVSKRRQQYQTNSNSTLIDFGNDNLTDEEVYRRLQLQQQMKMNNDLLIRQNEEQFTIEEQVQLVQTDVIEINHIMRDIAGIVSDQSPIIAETERNVTAANDHIVAGNNQLRDAARHQKNYRKKICWLLLILLIIAVIVAVIILIKFKA